MSAAWSCSRSSGHTAPGRFARSVQERHFSGGVVICTARRALVGRCATSSGGASYHDRWRLYLHNIGTDAAAIRGEA